MGDSTVGVLSEKSDEEVDTVFAGDRDGEPNEVSERVGVRESA